MCKYYKNNPYKSIDVENLGIEYFLSDTQREALANHVEIAKRLVAGDSYAKIVKDLQVSTATVAKVSAKLSAVG